MLLETSIIVLALIVCGFCGRETHQASSYIRHISFAHRGEPYFHITCGINGCPNTYRRYSSFTSHVYRKHKLALNDYRETEKTKDTSVNVSSANQQLFIETECQANICSICKELFSSSNQLIKHQYTHIKDGHTVRCPLSNCYREYNVLKSFTSHLSRCHKKTTTDNESESRNQTANDMQTDHICDYEETLIGSEVPSDFENESVFIKSLLQSFLKIQEYERLPISAMDKIIEEMKFCSSYAFSYAKASVLSVLEKNDVSLDIQSQVANKLDNNIFASSICRLDTAYKRKALFMDHFKVVSPVTMLLGRNAAHKDRTFQYIPILDSLKTLLQNSDILSKVLEGNCKESSFLLSDYSDGYLFKRNNLFSSNAIALQIILYFDEFEVVNPLGSSKGKQKLAAVYMSLGNLNVFLRSELKSIQLCLLCPVVDLKYFGINKIFEPLIYDLKILETEGIFVEDIKQHLLGTIAYICADNLGSHQIGGFFESFGPNVTRICRFCMATSSEIQDRFDPTYFTERTEEMYEYQLCEVEKNKSLSSVYGIKQGSVFNELKYFHVATGLPPDCMHDLLEGCVKKEIPAVLKNLVADLALSEQEVLSKIQVFSFGKSEVRDIPASPKSFSNLTSQSASQMWTLLRFLPLMLGSLIPTGHRVWEVLLLLKDITELVVSPVINRHLCAYLQTLITDHHLLLRETLPDFRLSPKHHYLIHYPDMILRYGSLHSCWCMRFEAKHSYFKKLAIRLGNYKNLPSTLATRHQHLQACVSSAALGHYKPIVEVRTSKSLPDTADLKEIKDKLRTKGFTLDDFVTTKAVQIQGIIYNSGSFIVTKVSSDEIMMSKILYILLKGEIILFIGKDYRCILDQHFRAYELFEMYTKEVYELKDLKNLVPLDMYRIEGKQYVVLKYYLHSSSF